MAGRRKTVSHERPSCGPGLLRCFVCGWFALRHMSASSLGITTYLVPPMTILMGWLVLGETPPTMAYVGGALALVGVALSRRRPKVREKEPQPVS